MQDTPASNPPSETSVPNVAADPAAIRLYIAERRAKQSLPLAVIAGVVAALVGAGLWAAVTVATGYQIGWMAVGVGFLVGYAVRAAGKGIDPVFGVIGAVFALLGCVAGNLFSTVGFVAQEEAVPFFEILGQVNLSNAIEVLGATFSPIDLLFYGIAIYEGYRFSFQQIAE